MSDRRLVVFDVDGTLIDSQELIVAAMNRAFAAAGHPPPSRENTLSIVGLSLPEAMAELAPHLSEPETLDLAARYRDGFVAQRAAGGSQNHAPLYPGALASLERLARAQDTVLGIATGKARRGLDHVFASHDIGHLFTTTQTADAHPSKPHPSMLLKALSETGVDASRAAIVGDTSFDMEMGRSAGMTSIGVTWGYHPPERLQAAGADVLVDSFEALHAALDAAWQRDHP
jgi:phosphoglycolate phosphatase